MTRTIGTTIDIFFLDYQPGQGKHKTTKTKRATRLPPTRTAKTKTVKTKNRTRIRTRTKTRTIRTTTDTFFLLDYQPEQGKGQSAQPA